MDFSSGEAFCLVFFSFTLGLTIVQQLLRARALKTKQKKNKQKKINTPNQRLMEGIKAMHAALHLQCLWQVL